jgi:ABC-type branched-subunit amino acid transport system ATPase component
MFHSSPGSSVHGAGLDSQVGVNFSNRKAGWECARARDRTVLMVEHNLSVVADLSDRITVLARGEVLAEGPYAEVSRNTQVIEAYMGTGEGAGHA